MNRRTGSHLFRSRSMNSVCMYVWMDGWMDGYEMGDGRWEMENQNAAGLIHRIKKKIWGGEKGFIFLA